MTDPKNRGTGQSRQRNASSQEQEPPQPELVEASEVVQRASAEEPPGEVKEAKRATRSSRSRGVKRKPKSRKAAAPEEAAPEEAAAPAAPVEVKEVPPAEPEPAPVVEPAAAVAGAAEAGSAAEAPEGKSRRRRGSRSRGRGRGRSGKGAQGEAGQPAVAADVEAPSATPVKVAAVTPEVRAAAPVQPVVAPEVREAAPVRPAVAPARPAPVAKAPGAGRRPVEPSADTPETATDASSETVSGIVKKTPIEAPAEVGEAEELDADTLAELELQAAEAAVEAQRPAQETTPPSAEAPAETVTGEMPPHRRRRRRRGRGRRGRGGEGQPQQGQPGQPGQAPAQVQMRAPQPMPQGPVDRPQPTPQARPQPPQVRPLPPQVRPQPPQIRPLPPQVRPLPPVAEEVVEAIEEEDEAAEATSNKVMLVNLAQSDECRIAMLEEGILQEFYVERTAALSHVGNVYKGVVTNIEPSIQAAFIDFGQGKNGFLHISDLQPQYFPGGGEAEDVGRKTPRRDRPPIQKCLRRNQEVVVQVTKEGIGTKGATLTTYVALPGRYLVMMPGMSRLGVSRKIEDEEARRSMRDVLNQLELPGEMGFILRTAGLDRNKRELQRDLNYLVRLWKQIMKRKSTIKSPAELYKESDLVTRTLRDVVTTDVQEILVDSEAVANSAKQFLRLLSPRLSERVKFYTGPQPLFFKYGVEDEIAKIYSKRVPLRSGGYLVIESTEALVAIDVNSGKFRETPDPEESAFRINVEAAEEIARQLSLRDLGGVIICDFIDMHMERHRREIERALRESLKKHKERAEILRMSRFGIIEMTRQRQRPSIVRSMLVDCPHCDGGGLIKSTETLVLETLRAIQTAATHPEVARIEVRVNSQVANMLLNTKRQTLAELEAASRRAIVVMATTDVSANKITVTCMDNRGWAVQVPLPKSLLNGTGSA